VFNGGIQGTYYLIDDVSVVASDAKADAGPDTHVGAGDSVFIGYHDMALDCYWTALGSSTVIGKGAGVWVRPAVTTSYVVTQTVCGYTTKDTVKVEVWKAGVTTINGRTQDYALTPNPNNGLIELRQLEADNRPVSIKVYNAVGAVVYASEVVFTGKGTQVQLSDAAAGVYYMVLQDRSGSVYRMQFVKK
jgi:hypothetical protein